MLALALLCLAQAPVPATRFDRIARLEIDASDPLLVLEGDRRGHRERFEFTSEFSGTLSVWTKVDGVPDLFLRIEAVDGALIDEDDDSGGGTTPYLAISVEPGRKLTVLVAARNEALCALELHLVASPETFETKGALKQAAETLPEIERLHEAGDLEAARALTAKMIEVVATAPGTSDSEASYLALSRLGQEAYELSFMRPAARAFELALAHSTRTRPDEHQDVQKDRQNLCATLMELGDLKGARLLAEKMIDVCSRTLESDAVGLQEARVNLGGIIAQQGDPSRARGLFEQAIEGFSRSVPDDDPNLQVARGNLAATLASLGDHAGAQTLFEKVLEVCSRILPEEHPYLRQSRINLATALADSGDLEGARKLLERVVEVDTTVMPDDHPDLQRARLNLSNTLFRLREVARARELREKVLDVFSRTLPDDHPDLQKARWKVAEAIAVGGNFAGARTLEEKVLEVFSRTLQDDGPLLQDARVHLAHTIACQQVGTAHSSTTPETTANADAARCFELIGAMCRSRVRAAREAIVESASREAEERSAYLTKSLDEVLSFALGYGTLPPAPSLAEDAFALSETTRGAALVSAELTRRATRSPKYRELHAALLEASDELASLSRKAATSDEFERARSKRESIERELVALAKDPSDPGSGGLEIDVATLAKRLDEDVAAVSFRRFSRLRLEAVDEQDSAGEPVVVEYQKSVDHLGAFVVRSSKATAKAGSAAEPISTFIDLGPLDAIVGAIESRRVATEGSAARSRPLTAGSVETDFERAGRLRSLVFDPLLPALSEVRHLIVVLDDVLNLVPLDALPLAGSDEVLGDRFRIETRATLTELLGSNPSSTTGELVALGGASFDEPPGEASSETSAVPRQVGEAGLTTGVPEVLRGGGWEHGFLPLANTEAEVQGIGALFRGAFGDAHPGIVLERRAASRASLVALGPTARFLHIATHGWFAPESILSWSDPEPVDKLSGLGGRMSGEQKVRGMSPMLLCGLALAGANLPQDAAGRAPGLVTAEEISALDLSNCDLAVLSACDTNVGVRRAGQGVASFQRALQMAGARSVITSLWKVPDEATKDLMIDFYRRLWVEKKPKWQALWEAKAQLRKARDANGRPIYQVRDWAAWVLTGSPE